MMNNHSTDKRLAERRYLYRRHRLSHQQIDRLLGGSPTPISMSEKVNQLETVRKFLDLTDSLREKDIFFVPLKGCILSNRIYGDPTIRFSHDIDIFVRLNELEKVVLLMKEKGFHISDNEALTVTKETPKWFFSLLHHLVFYNKAQHLVVEIHWSLTENMAVSTGRSLQLLYENLTEITFAGRRFKVMNPEFELLFLLIHGSRHRWERLKWLIDIRDYPVDSMDMERWNRLVGIFKAGRLIGQADYLLEFYFRSRLDIPYKKGGLPSIMLKYPVSCLEREMETSITVKKFLMDFYYSLFLFPTIGYKIRVLDNIMIRPGDLKYFDTSYKLAYCFYRPYSFIKRRILHA
ncbi:MAG: nucleotidyltransferase family protein [Bacteroidales bacterium]|jgi:hypothetical protein|nr:nucleotidyltransferase family protein [Bacteroidales bacterium]MCI1784913.1 nucleotidyltransferase family protein [Bacteroidales bacterium]